MKSTFKGIICTGLFLIASSSFAVTTTSLDSNWTCTTNASSSDVPSDKAADKQMSETPKSASDAFALASKNCRDCTKITCEVSE
ncbi:MAG: hypothetical protein EPN84_03330 [Legionella sp.]|nr:MAG: hypothetical protein EPN84_03330 [Legionella sp.]